MGAVWAAGWGLWIWFVVTLALALLTGLWEAWQRWRRPSHLWLRSLTVGLTVLIAAALVYFLLNPPRMIPHARH